MAIISSCRENGEIIISAGNRLTIENISDFMMHIRDGFSKSTRVSIVFEPETEIDITGIQAICSACRSAALEGKLFSYSGQLPRALSEMVSVCGVGRNSICKHNNDSTCLWFGGASQCQNLS